MQSLTIADIDECQSGTSKCPEHSLCVNLPGTYFCNCTEGFMPKGLPLERCAGNLNSLLSVAAYPRNLISEGRGCRTKDFRRRAPH